MTDPRVPFFILGAGFGADAGALVGPIEAESIYIGKYRFECAYPLVRDLPNICFPGAAPAVTVAEVEHRLAAAIRAGDRGPVERLCDELSKADHYLAPPLVGWPTRPNPYSRFFSDFSASSFATYNYDSFVEFALFRAGRWFPHDGYGVTVATGLGYTAEPYAVRPSQSLVLHLHGTYSVYTYETTFGPPDKSGVQWLELLQSPRFAFDPYSLSFYPFERFMAGLAYDPGPEARVVAPLPDKAVGLKGAFVQAAAAKAAAIIGQQGLAVAIGYAFSSHDTMSYTTLLESLSRASRPRAVVVAPDSIDTVARLRSEYAAIDWVAAPLGFAEWVDDGYPGLRRAV